MTQAHGSPYYLTVYERDHPARKILALLGDTPPTPSQGGGGYNILPLPQRSAVTVWQGVGNSGSGGLLLMDVAIVLGGAGTLRAASYDQNIAKAVKMWRPHSSTQAAPVLKLRAAGTIVPFQAVPWVLSDFTWGDAVANKKAHRTMQKLTLQFLEFREDERLQTIGGGTPRWGVDTRTYTVHRGDTLPSIARKFKLASWQDLGAAQTPPINEPRHIRVGQRLLIPAEQAFA